ncbi:hypothetical protein PV325_004536 [Microctonus aethiopoides]|nr:hypothetical protein PV325_004536 [Microctonus aethiopoides]
MDYVEGSRGYAQKHPTTSAFLCFLFSLYFFLDAVKRFEYGSKYMVNQKETREYLMQTGYKKNSTSAPRELSLREE